jgi:hypothetical protein
LRKNSIAMDLQREAGHGRRGELGVDHVSSRVTRVSLCLNGRSQE